MREGMRELCGALWSLVEHLLSIRTAGALEEKCERWKLGVRLTDIFNKYHAGLLIHKLYTKIHNTNIVLQCTSNILISPFQSFLNKINSSNYGGEARILMRESKLDTS